jgi:hypothetical protein
VRDLLISRCYLAKYRSPSGHGGLKEDPTTAINETPIMMPVATLVVQRKIRVLF